MGVPPSPTTATGCRGFYGIASPPASFRNDAADWIGTWLVDGAGHRVQQGATPALFLLSNEAPELARIRGIPSGIDLRSPSRHPDILGGDDLLIKVEEMREATGYRLPVSVKLGAGRVSDDVKIAVKDGFDFIELDGMQGSTGAGSAEVIDYVGVPTLPAIIEAIDALEEIGRRQDIEIVLMGGIRDGVDAVKALCLGADAVAFGTSTIIAGGCIACMQCHIGQCVTGIATQDPEHEQRYDPEAEHNIHRFLEGVRWQIAALTRPGVHRLPRSWGSRERRTSGSRRSGVPALNAGERPEMPETVVVVGGGDVAMDACRVAKRLPGCRHVKVIYRRGPGEIPARKIELHHAIKEDVEFLYHTQQVAVVPHGNLLALKCVKTALGEPDDDGRRRPVAIDGSEHEILCGSVIAAVGQRGICEELHRADMMAPDRVRTEWDSMRTSDPMVFAAGDGAFGGSTIVMAMQHGQRAGYYLRHFLEGNRDPLPYRTPLPHPPRAGRPGPHVGEVSHPGSGVLRTGRATGGVSRDRAHLRHECRPGGSGTLLPLRRGDRLGRLLGAAPRGHLLDGPHGSARCAEAQGDARPAAPARAFVPRRPRLPAREPVAAVIDPYREAARSAGGWASASISTFPSSSPRRWPSTVASLPWAPPTFRQPRVCSSASRDATPLPRLHDEGITQPFASTCWSTSCPDGWQTTAGRSCSTPAVPPVCVPLARNVSMKSRMLSRWRMVSVEWRVAAWAERMGRRLPSPRQPAVCRRYRSALRTDRGGGVRQRSSGVPGDDLQRHRDIRRLQCSRIARASGRGGPGGGGKRHA